MARDVVSCWYYCFFKTYIMYTQNSFLELKLNTTTLITALALSLPSIDRYEDEIHKKTHKAIEQD